LEVLSVVDEELTNQQTQRVVTNGVDEVESVQVTEEWTTFRDTCAMNMFVEIFLKLSHLLFFISFTFSRSYRIIDYTSVHFFLKSKHKKI